MSAHLLLRRVARFWTFLVLVLLLIGPVPGRGAGSLSELEVHFIDVGQGDSILVITPQRETLLIDAGDRRAGPQVVRYLKAQDVEKIDVLVGTHPHADHIGGFLTVLSSFPVQQIYDSGRIHTSKTFEDYLKAIDAKNIPFDLARAGDQISLGTEVKITVLWPTGPREALDFRDLNESSIVLLLEYGRIQFLFTGDVGIPSEAEIITQDFFKEAEILKVGHHGSYSSTGKEFLEALRPELGVISCGADNPYGHPHEETIQRLRSAGVEIFRIDLAGTAVVYSDGTEYRVVQSRETAGTPMEIEGNVQNLVNINTASLEELVELPGIGETLAQRIIEYRVRVGLFRSPEDLLKVKGIGEKTLAKIIGNITF